MRKAGIEGRSPCHAWRHTAATLLISGGTNVKVVQNLLGHANSSVTMNLYVHATEDRDREAGEYLASLVKK
jgi:integrase